MSDLREKLLQAIHIQHYNGTDGKPDAIETLIDDVCALRSALIILNEPVITPEGEVATDADALDYHERVINGVLFYSTARLKALGVEP